MSIAAIAPFVADKAGKTVDKLSGFLKSLVKNAPAIAIVSAAVPKIIDFIKGLVEPFQSVSEAVYDLGLTASEGFEELAEDISNSIYNLQPLAEEMGMWFADLYDDVQAKDWEALQDDVSGGLSQAWQAIVGFFEDTGRMEDVGHFAASIVNGIGDFLGGMTASDWDIIFNGIAVAMTEFFENVDWDAVFAGIYNAFTALAEGLVNIVDSTLSAWWEGLSENEQAGLTEAGWTMLGGV